MIHILNKLPEEYDAIFDDLENCPTLAGPDFLQFEVIHDTLNHWYKKIKRKGTKWKSNGKALTAYNKWFTDRCHKCGKIGDKSTNMKYPENAKKRWKVNKSFLGNVLIVKKQNIRRMIAQNQ